jgi:sugar lactone lactonase YvrE
MKTKTTTRRARILLGASLLSAMACVAVAGMAEAQIVITHFAPTLGGPGFDDGTGSAARFDYPAAVATDSAGNVFVADSNNHTIRKITPAGDVSTFAGTPGSSGSANGTGPAARFNWPQGVATDSADNVYVADSENHTIRKITPGGVVSTLAGTAGSIGSADGTGPASSFYYPYGVATDSGGNVYVADTGNSVIRKITSAGVVSTLAGTAGSIGSADGTGPAARFYYPYGVATDAFGNVYVADTQSHTIRKITSAGIVSTLAGTAGIVGSADGAGPFAQFYYPYGVATDAGGNVYVADNANRVIRKITPAGIVSTLAGTAGIVGSADGTGPDAQFDTPSGVATDSAGNVYVADTFNYTIRKITPDGLVSRLAGPIGSFRSSGSADGVGSTPKFDEPDGVATDSAGNVYVADTDNHTIRKISPAGVVSTLAGTAGFHGSADGIGAAARFWWPSGVAIDSANSVYVADTFNHTIRKITPEGVVTTLAGTAGSIGSTDGTGASARFDYPHGVATDSANNVYVADTGNSIIRKISPAGVVSTLAGTAGFHGSADGTGPAASFSYPSGVATDSANNVYVADTGNSTIRKITSEGVTSTLAGTAGSSGSADGTGPAAQFNGPCGVATDSANNVFVADTYNHTVRKITPEGVVSTPAGLAENSGYVDGPGPAARFDFPWTVAIDSFGNIYIADDLNNAIRKGEAVLSDVAVIDASNGCPGSIRQLDASPQTATAWSWAQIGRPAGSSSSLSTIAIRNPTFTPDVPGRFEFRLDAEGPTGRSITTVSFTATAVVSGPADKVVCTGRGTSFTVTPTANGTATYQWKKDGAPLAGKTESTLSLSTVTVDDEGFYSCDVADDCGVVGSPAARLLVGSFLPAIESQPSAVSTCLGAAASFTVTATNAISYRWKKDGSPMLGATSSTYDIASVVADDAASYSCDVTNDCGTTTSNEAVLTLLAPSPITEQPVPFSVCVGHPATFTVSAASGSYRWNRDDVPIIGATSNVLVVPFVGVADAGSYSCTVTCGTSVASDPALLTVVDSCGGSRPVPSGVGGVGTPTKALPNASNPDRTDIFLDVATCTSGDYILYRSTIGSFDAVIDGVCSLGVGGSRQNVSIPGDSWWILAGTDAGVVSSFGRSSAGEERALTGWGLGGVCPTAPSQDTATTCP